MRILLISANVATSPYPVYPIGMSMVATALQDAGHTVEMFDYLQNGCSDEAVCNKVGDVMPDLVGVSIRNVDNVNSAHEERYIDGVQKMVTAIKAVTESPVVLGGTGFSVMPEAVLDAVGAHFGVVGEGEVLMCDLVAAIAKGEPPQTPILRAATPMDVAAIPQACYSPDMMAFYQERGKMVSVQTKRGCDKHCSYCSYPVLEGCVVRGRLPTAVVDDIEFLINERGAEYIFFVDSVFNDSTGHYRLVVEEMHRRDICVKWTAFFTPGGDLDDAIVELMKQTGLDAVEIGADAATDTTLKGIAKDFNWQDVIACNDLFARHGIASAHYYMFGGPGETPDTVREGIANIRALKRTANFMFTGIRILPDTPLMRQAINEGMLAPEASILDPVYYFSPQIERTWLEQTLTDGFSDLIHCVYPPDALDDKLRFLHKMGIGGSAYSMLIGRG